MNTASPYHNLKVGSFVYATTQGLGVLAKSLYDHGIITHPFVVRHSSHPTHEDWYPDAPSIDASVLSRSDPAGLREWLSQLDVFLAIETPFLWGLFPTCKILGVKCALLTMYECTPRVLPSEPDLYLCPSDLDSLYFPSESSVGVLVPVCPGCTTHHGHPCSHPTPWRLRERAQIFVHHAGNGSFRDRNGTLAILEALPYLKSEARVIIRTQRPLTTLRTDLYEIRQGTVPFRELWQDGDVFLYPERFNGLSLPLQEAYASGLLVMATDRYPMNTWLPRRPLIPPDGYQRASISGAYKEFDEARLDPKKIAAKIDGWYGKDITHYSRMGERWAQENLWDNLRPVWVKTLEDLVGARKAGRS